MPLSIRARRRASRPASGPTRCARCFGEYRAPTGVVARPSRRRRATRPRRCARACDALGSELGRPLKILVGKPGLDGHSNGAEQIAVRRATSASRSSTRASASRPRRSCSSARDEGVHVIGLSILSGSHGVLVVDVLERPARGGLRRAARSWSAASSPRRTRARCARAGVARVYTPKDFDLTRIMDEIVDVVAGGARCRAERSPRDSRARRARGAVAAAR